ncbi:MAG: polyphosphate polymerase domain-containing protein [Oscillospiraceae bacterium]|nr:polyphosphate polymerase domain-containing protein [Oscillospiraceae bacterium]
MKLIHQLPNQETNGDKFRNELKYICSEGELIQIQSRIQGLCQHDAHAGSDGIYHIRSIYFDDFQNRYFYENENGTDPREKFRIRIYNASDSRISLECKKKEKMMTHKDSCSLTREQYRLIMDGQLSSADVNSELLEKFYLLQEQRYLQPKVIVAYDRTPFVYTFGNVRITFDRNIGSSTDFQNFFEQNLPQRPILPLGKQILEVKYDELLPNFLYEAMNLGSLQRTTFSKYYLCRKFTF